MNPSRPPKRVARACDYCRNKRLKCTGQRPCMNCQLYRVTCSTSDHSNGLGSSRGTSGGRRRKRSATKEQIEQEETQELTQSSTDAEQRAQTLSPWNPTSDPKNSSLDQPSEIGPDFDQYAYDLGLVLDPFWPPNSPSSIPLNGLDAMGDWTASSIPQYPAHLPTPRLSELDPPGTVFQSLDIGPTLNAAHFTSSSQPDPIDPPPSRSAHELFLRKGASDSKFIGMGSVGSTISECLRYSISTHGQSMESTVLDHLVHGIRHVDELALSTVFENPPLPEKGFAKQGVQAYFDNLHLLYPIMEMEFLDEWCQIYNDNYTLSPVEYSRFCLVVSVGHLVSPLRPDSGTWETTQQLQEQTWSLIDRVMASPFMDSLQVMLLHTVFFLYCGKTGIAWMTCGIAVRIAQSLGLHQHTPSRLGLSAIHISLRSKLWSVAYTLDTFLSLSEGRPPAITGSPNLGSSHRHAKQESPLAATKSPASYMHNKYVDLAVIGNKFLILLKSGESSLGMLAQIAEIDAQLLAWKDSIPIEFRPDAQTLAEDHLYFLVAMLHLKYHNLMRTVHWVSLTLLSEEMGCDLSRLGARVRSSESICVTAARAIIEVLNGTSSQQIVGSPGGFIVPYCMAAISTFYRQILKEPTRHNARTNLEYMRTGTLHILTLIDGIGPRRHFPALFKRMLQVAEGVASKAPDPHVMLQMDGISN